MISCEMYDYVEIVCTFKYPLKLTLKSGEIVEGRGVDTFINEGRLESIKLEGNSRVNAVPLDDIAVLEVTVENPHVSRLAFEA